MRFLPSNLRDQGTRLLIPVLDLFVRTGVSPNTVTTTGFLVTVSAGVAFFYGNLQVGGFLVLLGGFFDVVDGYVARRTDRVTRFGSFYDSTLDRVSEVVVFLGVFSLYNGSEPNIGEPWMVYVVALAMAGSLLVSYTRARAEAMGIDCRVGLMQRAERVILLGAATLFFGSWQAGLVLTWVMFVMAILTNLTALYRVYWVFRHTRAQPAILRGAAHPGGPGQPANRSY
jgi:CDP-diacylglycerol---glycerol-3-phosphate 3-phosphatidyltransferase